MLKHLVTAPNFCINILSKSLACLLSHSLEKEQDVLMTLEVSEVAIICKALANMDKNKFVTLQDFYMSLTCRELLMIIKGMCTFSPNVSVLLSQLSLLSTLHNLLDVYKTDIDLIKVLLLILIEFSQCPLFENTLIQSSFSFIEPVSELMNIHDVYLRNISSILLCCLQRKNISSAIEVFFQETGEFLSENVDATNGSFHYFLSSLCNSLDMSYTLLSITNEGDKAILPTDLMTALFKAASALFTGNIFVYKA